MRASPFFAPAFLGSAACAGALALIACGGANPVDVFSSGGSSDPSASATGTGTGDPPGGPPPSTTTPPTPTATTPGCTPIKYYRDLDGDGVGGTETKTSCTSPGDEWTPKGGDCDDDNPDVFPGQTAYFAQSYQLPGGKHSFDYNCSSTEEQAAPPRKGATPCVLGIGVCTGGGYLPPDPARPASAGIDPLCGAVRLQSCKFVNSGGGACQTVVSGDVLPTSCR